MQNQTVKLELGVVLRGAFGFVFENISHLIRAAFFPFLVTVAAGLFVLYAVGIGKSLDPITLAQDPNFIFVSLITNIISAVASLAFACSWHRSTLIGAESPRTGLGFFFGQLELIYIGRLMLIGLIMIPAFFIVLLVLVPLFGSSSSVMTFGLAALLLFSLVVYVYARLSLALPAAAIGHTTFTLRRSWIATSPVQWDLFWAHIIFNVIVGAGALIAALLINGLVSIIFASLPALAAIATVLANGAITFLSTACLTSFLSWLYGQLGEKPSWIG